MTHKALLAATVVATLGSPAAAQAATTIGELPPGLTQGCNPGRIYLQAATGHDPRYAVPAGGGVITSWQTKDLQADPGAAVTLKTLVLESGDATFGFTYRVRSSDVPRKVQSGTVTYPNAASPMPVRMPVADGELLGFYLAPGYVYQCRFDAADSADELRFGPSADAAVGGAFTTTGFAYERVNAAAVVEPDVDKDGFGDESQDSCPGSAGPNGGCPPPPPPDTTKPTVLSLRFATSTFRAAARGAAVARAPVGSRVRYGLSESATTRFTIERRTSGRRSGRRCVAPTRRNRRARRCVRHVRLKGSFTRAATAGQNSFRLSGRWRGRKLRPGRYRLVSVATDAAGNRSGAKRARFRIVRR